ncbi:MAG TPA: hypothetical protein VK050_10715 [Flavobacteriaceae bacterium]|nr:hypothetical protein [Flavobacteriaceae bacterium]
MQNFINISELLTALNREKELLSEMFGKRKSIDYKYSDAIELVDFDENRLEFLIQKEVIRENNELLELSDTYLEFFEQILGVNEEINAAYIDESIQKIKENIDYFLNENNPARKHAYLMVIKNTFRKIGKITYRSVIDLRRNVENTFKNEPNYKNKQLKLKNLDEKRALIKSLIHQTLVLTDNDERTFYNRASDSELKLIIVDLKIQLNECSHNLIEIERQIIDYLNQIDLQGAFLEKLRKIKYLKDHFTLEAETNIRQVLSQRNHVLFEKRIAEPLPLSLDFLRNDDTAFESIKRIAEKHKNRLKEQPVLADQISNESLENEVEEEIMVDFEAIKNYFIATSQDLFQFLMNYDFLTPMSFDDRVTIYCQMASQYEQDFEITEEFAVEDTIEYAIIYPK